VARKKSYSEVEAPEFQTMINYLTPNEPMLTITTREGIRKCVIKHFENYRSEFITMLQVNP
jgi:hypothetical protein